MRLSRRKPNHSVYRHTIHIQTHAAVISSALEFESQNLKLSPLLCPNVTYRAILISSLVFSSRTLASYEYCSGAGIGESTFSLDPLQEKENKGALEALHEQEHSEIVRLLGDLSGVSKAFGQSASFTLERSVVDEGTRGASKRGDGKEDTERNW